MEKITEKNNLKQDKNSNILEEVEESMTKIEKAVEDALNKQGDFLSSDENSKTEKIKEYTRLAIFVPTMIIPKILILIKY